MILKIILFEDVILILPVLTGAVLLLSRLIKLILLVRRIKNVNSKQGLCYHFIASVNQLV